MTRPRAAHPEHADEQAYIERAHAADEKTRERAQRAAEHAGDPYAARTARNLMLERFNEPVDLDSLCFGRIDLENGNRYYLGRGAIRGDDNSPLVVNWRTPLAAPFYQGSRKDPQGSNRRRRFQLEKVRLLGIVEDVFSNHHPDRPRIRVVCARGAHPARTQLLTPPR